MLLSQRGKSADSGNVRLESKQSEARLNKEQGKGGFVFKENPSHLFGETQEVETNVNVEGYDSSGETQLRKTDKDGVQPQRSNRAVEENKGNSERGDGRTKGSSKEEYDNRDFQRGIVHNVFHGTPYNFANHEKNYVDLGIHFGTEEQAKARLNKEQGNILQRDLKLENPLITQDIFGERTPEEYVKEIVKNEVQDNDRTLERRELKFDGSPQSNTTVSGREGNVIRRIYGDGGRNDTPTGEVGRSNYLRGGEVNNKSKESVDNAQRPSERGTADSRTENSRNETEVGAGELSYDDFTLDKTKNTKTN